MKTLRRLTLTVYGARKIVDLMSQHFNLQQKEQLSAAKRVACADFDVPGVKRLMRPL
ncbi:hypothetical protein F442_19474 [Phytophthora nicotianae P10297]|uniref:Uncharacterized protein n=1 Tax=Phytophthora nicotianae P10297 TaxID=1317064 RepID=W2YAM8_PHYNI|nr:hypothetical protein F442_19474 [Phytophthora nicotianae P10297]